MQVKEFQSDKIDQEDAVQGTDPDLDVLQTSPGSVHVYSEPEISDTEPTSISPLPLSDILHDSSQIILALQQIRIIKISCCSLSVLIYLCMRIHKLQHRMMVQI
jgi:hypothetical protein